jgi:ribosomal protein L34E
MKIGQEGDTRKYRKLKKDDYYDTKTAVEADKRRKPYIQNCKTCGQPITGLNTNGYCLRCALEGST